MNAYGGVQIRSKLYGGEIHALVLVPPVPIKYEDGWATGLVCALGEEKKLLLMLGITLQFHGCPP